MNLGELCGYLRNWFLRSDDDRHIGRFEIVGGTIDLPWLADGQFFRIIGSVSNDGVYRYPAAELTDESFVGAVWAMAVPPDVVSLADEIAAWQEKYADAAASPYQSESFGGYSYTKADAADGGLTWQKAFRDRLKAWRKL